jgi:hypothetical protein
MFQVLLRHTSRTKIFHHNMPCYSGYDDYFPVAQPDLTNDISRIIRKPTHLFTKYIEGSHIALSNTTYTRYENGNLHLDSFQLRGHSGSFALYYLEEMNSSWNYQEYNDKTDIEDRIELLSELSSDVLSVVTSYLSVDDLFNLSLALPDFPEVCWRMCASMKLKELQMEHLLPQLDHMTQSTSGPNTFRNLVLFSGMDQMHLLYNRSILEPIEDIEDTRLVISFKMPCSNQNKSIRVIKNYGKVNLKHVTEFDCVSSVELTCPSEQELIEKLILNKSNWKAPTNFQYRTNSGWKFM